MENSKDKDNPHFNKLVTGEQVIYITLYNSRIGGSWLGERHFLTLYSLLPLPFSTCEHSQFLANFQYLQTDLGTGPRACA